MTHFTSKPMTIGKHEWRIIVFDYGGNDYWPPVAPCRCTRYEWRNLCDVKDGTRFDWRNETQWPSYNHNDGTYGGLPKTLRTLWERNRVAVQAALKGEPIPDDPQLSLI